MLDNNYVLCDFEFTRYVLRNFNFNVAILLPLCIELFELQTILFENKYAKWKSVAVTSHSDPQAEVAYTFSVYHDLKLLIHNPTCGPDQHIITNHS